MGLLALIKFQFTYKVKRLSKKAASFFCASLSKVRYLKLRKESTLYGATMINISF